MKMLLIFGLLSLQLFSCTNDPFENAPAKWPDITLVNNVSFKDSTFNNDLAGCAFLIQTPKGKFACTCKHALWVAKSSEMKGIHFENTLKEWIMHPKNNKNESVLVANLLNEDREELIGEANVRKDWLIFEIKENHSSVTPLKIRTKPLVPGEKFYAIGWTFKDKTGPQRVHEFRFVKKVGPKLLLENVTEPLNKAGLSGAPVVDVAGELVGITSDFTFDPATKQHLPSPCATDYLLEVLQKNGYL